MLYKRRRKTGHIQDEDRRNYTDELMISSFFSSFIFYRPALSSSRDPANCHILNHHSTTVSNRFAQPKASVSTPSRSSKYSKAISGQHHHQKDRVQGSIYEDQQQKQSGVSTNSNKTNQPDEEAVPEWMDDNPSDLTKDEQTEKMVLDSFHLEAWKLRMKQLDDKNCKSRNGDDNNRSHLATDSNDADSLLALESLHLSTTSSSSPSDQDDLTSYSAKTISVHDLFQQHHHLPSPPSLSPLARQQQQQQTDSSSSAIGTPSYLLSPRDDQIGGFGQILSKQPIIGKDNNEVFVANGGYMNVTQHHQDHQRPPPGFMLPSSGHPRPPTMMSASFSTGTMGSHHHHHHHHYRQYPMFPDQQQQQQQQQHHHHQPMQSPSYLPSNNTNNSMIPSFPLFHHPHPSSHHSMLFNRNQQAVLVSQPQPFLHQQHQQQPFIPPPPTPPSSQHHFMPQMHTFPSQLLHHPYHQPLASQPLVSELNK
ncbi:unnamed protein product [Absidia cylindrospora]